MPLLNSSGDALIVLHVVVKLLILFRLKDYLGSGQFGFVHKGIWKGSLVAVKSLRNETTDINRVKFLQEAAIMGQFSHSNIVKLYGLVNERDDNIVRIQITDNT